MSKPIDPKNLESVDDVMGALAHHAKLAIVFADVRQRLPDMVSGKGADGAKRLCSWSKKMVDLAGRLDVPLGHEMLLERKALAHLVDVLTSVYRQRQDGADGETTLRILNEKLGHLLSPEDVDALNIDPSQITEPEKNSGNWGGPKDAAFVMAGKILESGSGKTVKSRIDELENARPVTESELAATHEAYVRFMDDFGKALRQKLGIE